MTSLMVSDIFGNVIFSRYYEKEIKNAIIDFKTEMIFIAINKDVIIMDMPDGRISMFYEATDEVLFISAFEEERGVYFEN